MSKTLLLKPKMSEKAYQMSKELKKFVFFVPKSASKQSIAHAVKTEFKVDVTSVDITNRKGKALSSHKKRGNMVRGSRSSVKLAVVSIRKDQDIPVYAAIDEQEAKQKKAETQMAKSAAKEGK